MAGARRQHRSLRDHQAEAALGPVPRDQQVEGAPRRVAGELPGEAQFVEHLLPAGEPDFVSRLDPGEAGRAFRPHRSDLEDRRASLRGAAERDRRPDPGPAPLRRVEQPPQGVGGGLRGETVEGGAVGRRRPGGEELHRRLAGGRRRQPHPDPGLDFRGLRLPRAPGEEELLAPFEHPANGGERLRALRPAAVERRHRTQRAANRRPAAARNGDRPDAAPGRMPDVHPVLPGTHRGERERRHAPLLAVEPDPPPARLALDPEAPGRGAEAHEPGQVVARFVRVEDEPGGPPAGRFQGDVVGAEGQPGEHQRRGEDLVGEPRRHRRAEVLRQGATGQPGHPAVHPDGDPGRGGDDGEHRADPVEFPGEREHFAGEEVRRPLADDGVPRALDADGVGPGEHRTGDERRLPEGLFPEEHDPPGGFRLDREVGHQFAPLRLEEVHRGGGDVGHIRPPAGVGEQHRPEVLRRLADFAAGQVGPGPVLQRPQVQLGLHRRQLAGGVPPLVERGEHFGEGEERRSRPVRERREGAEFREPGGDPRGFAALPRRRGGRGRAEEDAEDEPERPPRLGGPARAHRRTPTAPVASSSRNSAPSGPTSSETGRRTPPANTSPESTATSRNSRSWTRTRGPSRSST